MDQERARYLNEVGATLLCLNVPVGTQLIFDNKQMLAASLFKGYKMIPEGLHLFSYSAVNVEDKESISPNMNSCFIWFNKSQVIVKRWNVADEDFESSTTIQQQERDAYIQSVREHEFDQNLGAYPVDQESHLEWKQLTDTITQRLLDRILPIGGTIIGDLSESWMIESEKKNKNQTSNDRKEREILDKLERDLKDFKSKYNNEIEEDDNCDDDDNNNNNEKEIKKNNIEEVKETWGIPYYSKIPKTPKNLTPVQLSKWNMDRSQALEILLKRYYAGWEIEGLIGELQFSFVLFVYGLSYRAFVQWKSLLTLLLDCDQSVKDRPQLYTRLMVTLRHQFQVGPSDLFSSDLTSNIFLKPLLKNFIESIFTSNNNNKNDRMDQDDENNNNNNQFKKNNNNNNSILDDDEDNDIITTKISRSKQPTSTTTTSTTTTTTTNNNISIENEKEQQQLNSNLLKEILTLKRYLEFKFKWHLDLFEIPDDFDQFNPYDQENEDKPMIVITDHDF
ncbi:hypothetical protein DFA_00430 [Cavenderia fasciculata]|uniref:Uncharacterized protein n=1 Tax=Cavenderia fasciculata TaxID=261658 RepID=F4PRS0_CACFS|nr:uncharacterized protein DFA_00430 [Cavenderia fasciculata]EGG20569.1 hypothetical protein DFA_00430 [Cavenderia fasciculata]|eukprot:XP_004358419.1 hypothetical protein DFA_00430 [Cavenderia fasciculata]